MKNKLVLSIIAFALMSQAHADPRAFRVISGTEGDYALAWGVKGKKIDFEALDANETMRENFLAHDASNAQNYLVDLATNKVLTTLSDDDGPVYVGIHARPLASQFYVDISDISEFDLEKLNIGEPGLLSGIMQHNSYRHGSLLANIILIEGGTNENGHSKKVIAQCKDCQDQIEKQMNSHLTEKISGALEELTEHEWSAKIQAEENNYVNPKLFLKANLWASGRGPRNSREMQVDATYTISVVGDKVKLTLVPGSIVATEGK
jgi:hypothetical protein